MRVVSFLSIVASASAFGVTRQSTTFSTALNGMAENPTEKTLDQAAKAEKFNAMRFLSEEEAQAQLSGEDLETYNRYHSEAKEGVEKLEEIAKMMLKSLEPPRVAPKGKKQRKRDAWAKVSAREAARAAAAAK